MERVLLFKEEKKKELEKVLKQVRTVAKPLHNKYGEEQIQEFIRVEEEIVKQLKELEEDTIEIVYEQSLRAEREER